MARIPDEEIERLKRDIPIERLVKAAGIELHKLACTIPAEDPVVPAKSATPRQASITSVPGMCRHARKFQHQQRQSRRSGVWSRWRRQWG